MTDNMIYTKKMGVTFIKYFIKFNKTETMYSKFLSELRIKDKYFNFS